MKHLIVWCCLKWLMLKKLGPLLMQRYLSKCQAVSSKDTHPWVHRFPRTWITLPHSPISKGRLVLLLVRVWRTLFSTNQELWCPNFETSTRPTPSRSVSHSSTSSLSYSHRTTQMSYQPCVGIPCWKPGCHSWSSKLSVKNWRIQRA